MSGPSRAFSALLLGALLLAWPAFANGYPILFSDTHAFLIQAAEPRMVWDKPWVYGPFLHALHGRTTLWLPVLAQALLLSHLLWLAQAALSPPRPGRHLALCLVLAAASAAPWFAALLMPDFFTAPVVLCIFLLGFGAALSRGERVWAGAVGTLAVASHLSHLVLAAACIAGVAALARQWRPVLRAAAPLAGAMAILLATNAIGFGRLGISPNGAVFALARLAADGPARAVLARDCPHSGWYLCAWNGRLRDDSDWFLWDPDGPVWTHPGGAIGLAPEATAIVRRTVLTEPVAVARSALANTAAQLLSLRLGDTLDTNWLEESVIGSLRAYFPKQEEARYRASRQARGTLPALAAALWPLHAAALALGLAGTLWAACLRRTRALAVLVLLALPANAFATGALSAPHDRYQARIAWLLLVPPLLALEPDDRRRNRRGSGSCDQTRT